MEKENNIADSTKIITSYVSIWGWHILAALFLCTSLSLAAHFSKELASIFFFAFFVLFGICEVISYRRRNALYK